MKLNKLSVKDKEVFAKYLALARHELSVYAFQNIYIWQGLFDIKWTLIEDSLCVFFKDKMGCFLYFPPLGKNKNLKVSKKVFAIMDSLNKNKDISRIENIEENELSLYRAQGYECRNKSYDYLCLRNDLVNLAGNKFKAKRACYNYFIKHYNFEYLPFSLKYKDGCLELYNCWMRERKAQKQDYLYQGMLEDNRISLQTFLDNYKDLNVIGRVVKIKGALKAFTFGFKLNADTFCILYEIADLSIKGLAQFIFRRFCLELEDYKYINIMDDSGLQNLKKVKLSYHPARLVPAYIVKRKNEPRPS